MEIFISAIIIMLSLSIATFQLVRNAKYRELTERRQRIMPVVLYINTAMVILDLSVGGSSLGIRLLLDVMLTALALSLLSSSLWTASRSRMVVYFIMALQVMLSMYYILCLVSLSSLPHPICFRNAAVVVVIFSVVSVGNMGASACGQGSDAFRNCLGLSDIGCGFVLHGCCSDGIRAGIARME